VGMFILFAVLTTDDRVGFPGRFGSVENLLNILNQNFAYLILGVGMTVVIITGGIDLSVGALVALCGVVGTSITTLGGITLSESGVVHRLIPIGTPIGLMIVAGLFAALMTGTAVGASSGWMVTRFKVPPFIATLAWLM